MRIFKESLLMGDNNNNNCGGDYGGDSGDENLPL